MDHANRDFNDGNCSSTKPYLMVGAGRLSAAVWKTGSEYVGWDYRFNICSMDPFDGKVTQRFGPPDVVDLAKLAHVLASVLADDGCLDHGLREELRSLVNCLELIFCHEEE